MRAQIVERVHIRAKRFRQRAPNVFMCVPHHPRTTCAVRRFARLWNGCKNVRRAADMFLNAHVGLVRQTHGDDREVVA
jgi:hypothetical protein